MGNALDPIAATLLEKLQTAQSVVQIYRSAFPISNSFSVGFDNAVDWLRKNRPLVKLEVLTDPIMADAVVFFRADANIWAGPLLPPMPDPWISVAISAADFDEFFADQRTKNQHPDTSRPFNATPVQPDGTTLINDFSRLNETAVREVVGYKQARWPWAAFAPAEADLCNVVAQAARNGHKVSIAGKRHSQGGHTFYPDAVVLDMTDYNQILGLDPVAKTIRVQSGTSWDLIQRFIQPHGLSVAVMQAYPYFTVGGSLSVGVHESDLRFGPIIDTVNSFRLLLADGRVLDVSRTCNHDLFGLVIGGYGLFGLILDVELQLTDDMLLEQTVVTTHAADFAKQLRACMTDDSIIYGYARPCFVDDGRFMDEMSMVTCKRIPVGAQGAAPFEIQEMTYLGLRKLIYDLSRRYVWGKEIKWQLQTAYGDNFGINAISRNNLMRADIRIPGDYRSSSDTDALQEYFVSVDNFAQFAKDAGAILRQNDVNVMSVGVRYVPRSTASTLSYSAASDVLGVIMVINHARSPQGIEAVARWTRAIIDLALSLGGTYYLPYAAYATKDQARRAYPRLSEFIAKKNQYDPNHTFCNWFFENYCSS